MQKESKDKTDFGNWVPLKMIALPAILALFCSGLGIVSGYFFIPACLFLLVAIYFAGSWQIFSPRGGDVQDKVQVLVLRHIPKQPYAEVLDIGCGNGALTLKVAQSFPQARVTGVDYWGKSWDYSLGVCENNARALGVAERVTFRQASAAVLPFEDASFDLVVSNLCFHEVHDADDKRAPLREALRVLKPGGVFVLQDLFLLQAYFGTPEELQATLRGWGARDVAFIHTHEEKFIPGWVKLPFMLGTLAILRGGK